MEGANTRKLLNVGCGSKFHKDWVNIDMVSYHPDVIEHNILAGLPFPSDSFDVVYHSQVLEHIPRQYTADFLSECFRVLKPNGIMRVVLPNLENIVQEYQKNLNYCLTVNSQVAEANYDWILLEMYDQTVRNTPGGLMANYLENPVLVNETYILDRIGYVGRLIRDKVVNEKDNIASNTAGGTLSGYAQKILRNLTYKKVRQRILNALLTHEEKICLQVGQFRQGGEIHYWMYDRFSLSKLLMNIGFKGPCVKNPFDSDIPDWEKYELDVRNQSVYDPTSLFMEACKP